MSNKEIVKGYKRVMDMMYKDAEKRGITFYGFFYFREGDNIKELDDVKFSTLLNITAYDAATIKEIISADLTPQV